jgi:uncharacterized Zn finger protein
MTEATFYCGSCGHHKKIEVMIKRVGVKHPLCRACDEKGQARAKGRDLTKPSRIRIAAEKYRKGNPFWSKLQ